MIRGLDRVDDESLFPRMVMANTRGHSLKLRGDRFRTDVRGSFFTQSGGDMECPACSSSGLVNIKGIQMVIG